MNDIQTSYTKAGFEALCEQHDFAWQQADDMSVWRKGNKTMKALREYSKHLKPGVARTIYNKTVDAEFTRTYASMFYWKGE